jgi:uracil-DNA glycosylase family 4
MADNIYSMLAAYLRCQRDLGVEEIIFERGSAVGKILSVGRSRGAQPASPARTPGKRAAVGYGGHSAPQKAGVGGDAAASASSLSRLSKIRPADTLGLKKFERSAVSAGAPSARREKLAGLYRETAACRKCALSESRAKVVFGSGGANGRLLVIGDMPSSEDEAAGRPFQGESGDLLAKILAKMGLDRDKGVFATYVQKCRGAGGGFDGGSARICLPVLDGQIDIIEPEAILVFGQEAANVLLGNGDGIERLRAISHTYKNIPTVVTYSLSLMLSETRYRHGAWDDMRKVLGYAASSV